MTAAAAALGALTALGLVLVVAGLRRVDPPQDPRHSTSLWKTLWDRWDSLPTSTRRLAAGSLAAGVVVAATSGYVLAVVLIPALALTVPYLFAAPPSRELDLLAALDRWVRLLATSIGTGKSIRDAIFATRTQAPAVLRDAVDRLCARLDQRLSTREALLRFADDLDCADADAVAAALAIASTRGGIGTRATLHALSDTIQDRLRALREVATERAKPRVVVRQVTIITLAVLVGAIVLNGQFFAPYLTPLGQVIGLALAAAYLGCLLMLRRMTTPPPAPRFLGAQ